MKTSITESDLREHAGDPRAMCAYLGVAIVPDKPIVDADVLMVRGYLADAARRLGAMSDATSHEVGTYDKISNHTSLLALIRAVRVDERTKCVDMPPKTVYTFQQDHKESNK